MTMSAGNNLRGLRTRWRGNVGTEIAIAEGGAPYLALFQTPVSAPANALLQLRATVRKSSGNVSHTITLFYRKNGGSWFRVDSLSLPVFVAPAPHRYPPGEKTTLHEDQLQPFPGDDDWRGEIENQAATGGNAAATNVYDARVVSGGVTQLEHEWSLQLGGDGQLAVDDYLEFQMRAGTAVFEEGYFSTARVNIVPPAGPVCAQPGNTLPATTTTRPGQALPAVSAQPGATVAAVTVHTGPGPDTPIVPTAVPAYGDGLAPTESFWLAGNTDQIWLESPVDMIAIHPDMNDGFSLSFWFATPSPVSLRAPIGNVSDYFSRNENFAVSVWGPSPVFMRAYVGKSQTAGYFVSSVDDLVGNDSWHHVVVRYRPAHARVLTMLYDGVEMLDAGSIASVQPYTTKLFVGKLADSMSATVHYEGYVAEVSGWDRGLTDAEWVALYGAGTPPDIAARTGFLAQPLFWLNGVGFAGTANGDTCPDQSGAGNDFVSARDAGEPLFVTLQSEYP